MLSTINLTMNEMKWNLYLKQSTYNLLIFPVFIEETNYVWQDGSYHTLQLFLFLLH